MSGPDRIFGQGFRRFVVVGILVIGYITLTGLFAWREGIDNDVVKIMLAQLGSAFTLGVGVLFGQHSAIKPD